MQKKPALNRGMRNKKKIDMEACAAIENGAIRIPSFDVDLDI